MRKLKLITGLLVCAVLAFSTGSAMASTWNITGTGNWTDANNWTRGFPVNGSVIKIQSNAAYNNAVCQIDTDVFGAPSGNGPVLAWHRGYIEILNGGVLNFGNARNDVQKFGFEAAAEIRIFAGGTFTMGSSSIANPGGPFEIGDVGAFSSGINQMGGAANFIDIDKTDVYEGFTMSGIAMGRRGGGHGYYKISGGTLTLADGTNMYVGTAGTGGGSYGTFEVVGSAPTIDFGGGLLFLGNRGVMIADIGASGISTTANVGALTFTDGAKIQVVDQGAAPGTYRLISYTGALTGTPTLDAPEGWSMDIGSNYVDVTRVPEPGTLALIAMGGLALIRRRR